MVKCGPKPRKLTARQIRDLVREEKRNLSLQRQVVQAPPSPRKKKVWVRPSQFDVSLARKKRVKNYPRQMVPRKARSATSVAFSAITEEIPLFEELKRTNRLVYIRVPQQPVPLVWPQTPTRETSHVSSITSVADPVTPTAKCEYHGIPSGLALNISPGPNNEQLCLLSTPIASSTPLRIPSCAVNVQVLSPAYAEDKLQNMPPVFHDEAAIVTSSPKPAPSTVATHTGNPGIQCVPASEGGSSVSRAHTFADPSWTTHGKSNISTDRLLDSGPTYKEDSPRPQDSRSPSLDNLEQYNKRIVLPTIRPLVIQRRAQSLQASHILSQLPIEQDPNTTTFPRVQLPGTVLRSPVSINKSMQADSPETIYHRSLMASFWAESSGSPNVKDQSCLEGSFPVLHHANPRVVPKSQQSISPPVVLSALPLPNEDLVLATEKTTPVIEHSPCCLENQRYSGSNLVQLDSMHVVQPIKPTPSTLIEDSTLSSFRSKRRIFGTYRSHNVDRTAGAFANAILRQTGHLRQKDGNTPAAVVPVVQNHYPFGHDSAAVNVKNTGIQDQYMPSRFQGQPTPFNNMQYYLPSNGTLQSRAASIPSRLGIDELKVPLAPAAVIKDDPFKRPFMRPGRKRFFPTSRVLAYRVESNPYGQSELHKTSSARELLGEQITHAGRIVDKAATYSQNLGVLRPSAVAVDTGSASLRRKRHWAKRVVVDDICHRVSTDSTDMGASNVSLPGRSDQHSLPPQQAQTSLAVIPPSESEQTIKKRVTAEFSKKGNVLMALKAVYNKLWV
ncbi:hypothetical protein JOM56_005993 [Amanita muscaria]